MSNIEETNKNIEFQGEKMKADKMCLNEAIDIVDKMYQDRYKIVEEKDTIYVDKLDDVKFTNLEFASVRLLREVQSLQTKLENSLNMLKEKDKEMKKKDKMIDLMAEQLAGLTIWNIEKEVVKQYFKDKVDRIDNNGQ